ncbi:unnamed protein product, partial [Brassica oleracea]
VALSSRLSLFHETQACWSSLLGFLSQKSTLRFSVMRRSWTSTARILEQETVLGQASSRAVLGGSQRRIHLRGGRGWLNLYERWLSAMYVVRSWFRGLMPDIQKLERSLFCLFNICPGTSSSSIKERLIHCIAINNYLKFTMQWEALALLLIGISVNQLCSLPEGSHVDVRQRNKCHGWTSGYGRLSFNAKPSLNAENWHLVIVVSGILLT